MVETLGLARFSHQRLDFRRWMPAFVSSHKTLLSVVWIAAFASVFLWQRSAVGAGGFAIFRWQSPDAGRAVPRLRPVAFNLTDFGGVGDGVTVNTEAFERAIAAISKLGKRGGGQLNVPAGQWLTAPFNLTSHMTLFLAEGAVVLGIELMSAVYACPIVASAILALYPQYSHAFLHSGYRTGGSIKLLACILGVLGGGFVPYRMPFSLEDERDQKYWPLMPPLPSYGYGREHPGPRYGSLIHGQNLKDIVITGHNGTINGQGQSWWKKYRQKLLNHTRGPLVQIMWSSDIIISNITLRDSPFWTLHPYDCKNVTIKNVTILAPIFEAPNTDGIDPDSCEDMVIEDCYISVGDDAIAIKSGWDQYGIAYGRPSTNILIRNLVVRSMVSAGVSIGSEMSGGVSNVTVENLLVWDSRRAVRIKTAPGRGGYVRDIAYRNITFENVRVGIVIKTDYNEHPDEGYDKKAFPVLQRISFVGVHGQGVRVPVRIHGSEEIPVRNVTFRDMSVGLTYKKKHIFQCAFVQGRVIGTIFPAPCENLDLYDEQEKLVRHSASQNITDIDYDI